MGATRVLLAASLSTTACLWYHDDRFEGEVRLIDPAMWELVDIAVGKVVPLMFWRTMTNFE